MFLHAFGCSKQRLDASSSEERQEFTTDVATTLLPFRILRLGKLTKTLKFGGDQAVEHFAKYGNSIMKALGDKTYNLKNYINDANHVIQFGQYVPELNGYVKLIGVRGSAKYGFVGVTKDGRSITTFHVKTAQQLSKSAPSLGIIY